MLTQKVRKTVVSTALAAVMAAGSSVAAAQGMMGQDMGPGMMGQGMGPGMMGQGMGPGMMGQGMGPCMMGRGMGPGMMGRGMMGQGMTSGMMGVTDLSAEQQKRLAELRKEQARQQFDLMQELRKKRFELSQLYSSGTADPEAVGKAYADLADVQRRMFETRLKMRNQLRAIISQDEGSGTRGMSDDSSE